MSLVKKLRCEFRASECMQERENGSEISTLVFCQVCVNHFYDDALKDLTFSNICFVQKGRPFSNRSGGGGGGRGGGRERDEEGEREGRGN